MRGNHAAPSPTLPSGARGPGRISVAYGNIPAPGLEKVCFFVRLGCLRLSAGVLLAGVAKNPLKNDAEQRRKIKCVCLRRGPRQSASVSCVPGLVRF